MVYIDFISCKTRKWKLNYNDVYMGCVYGASTVKAMYKIPPYCPPSANAVCK